MRFNKIKRMIENLDAVKKYFQTRDKNQVGKTIRISEYRKKLANACDISDKLLEDKHLIPEIIELVSQKIEITKYPVGVPLFSTRIQTGNYCRDRN